MGVIYQETGGSSPLSSLLNLGMTIGGIATGNPWMAAGGLAGLSGQTQVQQILGVASQFKGGKPSALNTVNTVNPPQSAAPAPTQSLFTTQPFSQYFGQPSGLFNQLPPSFGGAPERGL